MLSRGISTVELGVENEWEREADRHRELHEVFMSLGARFSGLQRDKSPACNEFSASRQP
jgi:hypothetical protein